MRKLLVSRAAKGSLAGRSLVAYTVATTGWCDIELGRCRVRADQRRLFLLAPQPSPAIDISADVGGQRRRGRSWVFAGLALVALLAAVVGAGVALQGRHGASPANQVASFTPPPVTWPPGSHMAANFQLVDQRGVPISLRALRGRTAIVTFLDPLCRNVCPLEARVLADAIRGLPPAIRPAIIAVSVDPQGDTRVNFRADAAHWRLTGNWRWAIGSRKQLAAVWRKYQIEVRVVTKRVAGVTVREVEHGDAAFIIDRSGYRRAMFLFPFLAPDVEHEIRAIDSTS